MGFGKTTESESARIWSYGNEEVGAGDVVGWIHCYCGCRVEEAPGIAGESSPHLVPWGFGGNAKDIGRVEVAWRSRVPDSGEAARGSPAKARSPTAEARFSAVWLVQASDPRPQGDDGTSLFGPDNASKRSFPRPEPVLAVAFSCVESSVYPLSGQGFGLRVTISS